MNSWQWSYYQLWTVEIDRKVLLKNRTWKISLCVEWSQHSLNADWRNLRIWMGSLKNSIWYNLTHSDFKIWSKSSSLLILETNQITCSQASWVSQELLFCFVSNRKQYFRAWRNFFLVAIIAYYSKQMIFHRYSWS